MGTSEEAGRGRAYGIALGASCAAAALKIALGENLPAPYLLAVGAVALSAGVGGLGPGIVATLLSAAFVYVAVLAPAFTFHLDDPHDLVGLAVFVAVGVAVSLIAEQRRQAGMALAASEARYRDLHDNLPDGWVSGDGDGNILDSNETFRRMLGYTEAELRGLTFPQITPERWHEVERVRRAGDPARASPTWVFEKEYLRKDGSVVPVEIRSFIDYLDGRPVKISAIVRDVTERKQAEELLRTSEERYRLLADNALDVVWTMSLEGKVTYISPAVEKLRGFTVAEAMSQRLDEIHPPASAARSVEYFTRMLADVQAGRRPERFLGDLEYRCKDGSTIWTEVLALPVVGPDGAIQGLLGVSRDIRERMRAEEAVRTSEALLRAITSSSPDAIFGKDREGRWTFANEAALRFVGKPLQDVLGRTDAEIIGDPAVASALVTHDRSVLESGEAQNFEEELPSPSGVRVFLSTKAPLRDSTGNVAGTVGVAKDVTDVRKLQEQIQVSARLAAMGTLVAGVAHEINNPMTGIMAGLGTAMGDVRQNLKQMEQGKQPSQQALIELGNEILDVLADASEAATRVARIVKDLTIFGAARQERTRLRPEDVVAGAIRWLPSHVHGVATVTVEDLGAPFVNASRGQLEQVLVNLLTNAAKATVPGTKGTIRVRIGAGSPGNARLEVIDHGTGMDPAILGRIFDPFFTTRPAGDGRGTGLGLAICHAIVTDHGGTITVESEVGKGSTFRVELPAAPAQRGVTSRLKGCSPRNRHVTKNGRSHQGRFASVTIPRAGVAWGPKYSSNMMMETFANMIPDQKMAGTRIHSLPFSDGPDRGDVERAEDQDVDPDGRAPPGRPRVLERVEVVAPPVDHVDQDPRRPERVVEPEAVGDHQLFEVDDVGDEAEVDDEEGEQDPVDRPLSQGNGLAHAYRLTGGAFLRLMATFSTYVARRRSPTLSFSSWSIGPAFTW